MTRGDPQHAEGTRGRKDSPTLRIVSTSFGFYLRWCCCFHLAPGTRDTLWTATGSTQHGTARHGTDGQGRNFGQHISLSWYIKHLAYKYEPMYSHSHVQNTTVHDLTSGNNRSIIFLCTHTKRKRCRPRDKISRSLAAPTNTTRH